MDCDILIFLSVGFTLFCACGLINECIKDFQPWKKSKLQKLKPNVPYSRLIKEVVRWSGPILQKEGIKYYPHVKVSYRICKGAAGYYSPKRKTVEVLVNKNVCANSIVEVTLHELAHYLQHQSDPDFKNYDLYEYQFGYNKNKFELAADKFAKGYKMPCKKHLKAIGYI